MEALSSVVIYLPFLIWGAISLFICVAVSVISATEWALTERKHVVMGGRDSSLDGSEII